MSWLLTRKKRKKMIFSQTMMISHRRLSLRVCQRRRCKRMMTRKMILRTDMKISLTSRELNRGRLRTKSLRK